MPANAIISDAAFADVLERLRRYAEQQDPPHVLVPQSYCCTDGFPLGKTVNRLRQRWKTVPEHRRRRLEALGFELDGRTGVFNHKMELLEAWSVVSAGPPAKGVIVSGVDLGSFYRDQRRRFDDLAPDAQARLEHLPYFARTIGRGARSHEPHVRAAISAALTRVAFDPNGSSPMMAVRLKPVQNETNLTVPYEWHHFLVSQEHTFADLFTAIVAAFPDKYDTDDTWEFDVDAARVAGVFPSGNSKRTTGEETNAGSARLSDALGAGDHFTYSLGSDYTRVGTLVYPHKAWIAAADSSATQPQLVNITERPLPAHLRSIAQEDCGYDFDSAGLLVKQERSSRRR